MYYGASSAGDVLTLSGTDCSSPVSEGAKLVKTDDVAVIATLLDVDVPNINEEDGVDQFQGFIITADSADTTKICFCVTEDNDTDVVFTQYLDLIPLSEDASVEAGDGSIIPVA